MWPVDCKQDFAKIWPSDLLFDMNLLIFKRGQDSIKTNTLSLRKINSNMWPVECKQDFTKIWPSDLLFDLTLPIFNRGQENIKTNILIEFEKDWVKNVACRE